MLYVTLGMYSPYVDNGVWVPAVDPQWQISFNTKGQTRMVNLTGTEEMPVNEDMLLVPVGIIDVDDEHQVRKYLKQVLHKMWTLHRLC